jgi:hypothetical protein
MGIFCRKNVQPALSSAPVQTPIVDRTEFRQKISVSFFSDPKTIGGAFLGRFAAPCVCPNGLAGSQRQTTGGWLLGWGGGNMIFGKQWTE